MENTINRSTNQEIIEIEKQRDEEMERRAYEEIESPINTEEIERKKSKKKDHKILKSEKIIYYVLGVLEILFLFRFVFKILGANTESTFVSVIYSISDIFLAPFTGIFRMAVTEGIETEAILEPHLIIGMVVYALLAWGIVKLIRISNSRNSSDTI